MSSLGVVILCTSPRFIHSKTAATIPLPNVRALKDLSFEFAATVIICSSTTMHHQIKRNDNFLVLDMLTRGTTEKRTEGLIRGMVVRG